jgi:hypothetical protein
MDKSCVYVLLRPQSHPPFSLPLHRVTDPWMFYAQEINSCHCMYLPRGFDDWSVLKATSPMYAIPCTKEDGPTNNGNRGNNDSIQICTKIYICKYIITNFVALVREQTLPTVRPPLVSEIIANSCGWRGVA